MPNMQKFLAGLLATGAVLTGAAIIHATPVVTPVVTITLSINDNGAGANTPGDFAVYASDSPDNFGIQSYQVTLTGDTSVVNMGPQTTYHNSNPPSGWSKSMTAGFTLLNSGTGNPITGSEPVPTSPTGPQGFVPIFGFGQSAGDLGRSPPRPANYQDVGSLTNGTQEQYSARLLLATGTYSNSSVPLFDISQLSNNEVTVYRDKSNNGGDGEFATVRLTVPEPASLLTFIVGAGAGLLLIGRGRGRYCRLRP